MIGSLELISMYITSLVVKILKLIFQGENT